MKKLFTFLMTLVFVLSSVAAVLTPRVAVAPKAKKVGNIAAQQVAMGKPSVKDINFKYRRSAVKAAALRQDAKGINYTYVLEADIEITVDNIQPTTAHFTIAPGNVDEYYFFSVLDKESFDSMTEAEVQAYCKADIEKQIGIFTQFNMPANYATFCYIQQTISGTYTELEPNTNYVVVAYYMEGETGEPLSGLSKAEFTTAEDIEKPITDTLAVHIIDPEWKNYVEEEGWWQMRGYSEDEAYYVSLSNIYNEEVPGTYTIDDMDIEYSVLYLVNEDQQVEFKTLDVTVTIEGDFLTIKAEADAKNGVHYSITFDTIDLSKPQGNAYDLRDDDVVADFTTEETTIEIDEEECYAYILAEHEGELLSMLLYLDGTELTAGTYEVNNAYEPGSVQPCSIGAGGVYPSFYATLLDEDNLNVPFFFFASGTVNVSFDAAGNLVLTADVLNTWLHSGKFTINANADAIERVNGTKKGSVLKTIENGQIIIKKNGKRYNVMGIQN